MVYGLKASFPDFFSYIFDDIKGKLASFIIEFILSTLDKSSTPTLNAL